MKGKKRAKAVLKNVKVSGPKFYDDSVKVKNYVGLAFRASMGACQVIVVADSKTDLQRAYDEFIKRPGFGIDWKLCKRVSITKVKS